MHHAIETRLQDLLEQPIAEESAQRDILLRDVLLLQLARQVGAPIQGVYDDDDQLRTDEIATRIREAALTLPQPAAAKPRAARSFRFTLTPAQKRTWTLAAFFLGPLIIAVAIAALAARMGLFPGLFSGL